LGFLQLTNLGEFTFLGVTNLGEVYLLEILGVTRFGEVYLKFLTKLDMYVYLSREIDMNKFALIIVLALSVIFVYAGCTDVNTEDFDLENLSSFVIEGLTFNNFPKLDGSTTSDRLLRTIILRLLGIDYRWEGWVVPNLDEKDREKLWFSLFSSSQTHQSFVNLINNEKELIITARKMSSYKKKLVYNVYYK